MDGTTIFYAWGKGAPTLTYPRGTGLDVGTSAGISYIVLQVHYLNKRPPDDSSGVEVKYLKEQTPQHISLFIGAPSFFKIPPGVPEFNVTLDCCFDDFQPFYPLALRVHAHELGRRVLLQKGSKPAAADSKWRFHGVRARGCT
jgi:hypothetical protein